MSVSRAGDACAEPERRRFDFWIGSWEVRQPDGTVAGRNRVEPLFEGCGLAEHWEGESGLRGASYTVYDAGRGVWHQTWVDSSGSLLLLEGGWRDGGMVLEGSTASAADGALRHRITWSVADGAAEAVRQHWEVSRDNGATWSTAFDGRYRPVGTEDVEAASRGA